jgi:hypothetical protein
MASGMSKEIMDKRMAVVGGGSIGGYTGGQLTQSVAAAYPQ